ncbi:NAD-dependent epimerase/dehydratase family protein [Pseudonocardia xinjiangensis]|uniref:NAD-dependent epimerase/dehydratase family protein n=1 Tax=Pseudonocardia xinjiangensis TaxID=75289 RepID=UPI003D8B69F0
MRVFLAGATGVVGSRLLPLLIDAGHHVTALTRRPERAATLRAAAAEPVVADVLDAGALAEVVRRAAPDVVMHQLTDLSAADTAANARLRTIGTRHLVDAALAAGVQRIVAQSIAWAYTSGAGPAAENEPLDRDAPEPRQRTVLAVDALERAVAEAAEPVVLRYGMFYGPGTWFEPAGLRATEAREGRLAATADVTSFLHVDDAAAAAVAALRWPPGTVNVCDDEPAAGREWVPAFCAAVAAPAPTVDEDTPRAGWARGADNRYARERLGWEPRYPAWRAGFALMAEADHRAARG